MCDGFMRSPEAVLECNAYHDAPPQDDAAFALCVPKVDIRIIVAEVIIERLMIAN